MHKRSKREQVAEIRAEVQKEGMSAMTRTSKRPQRSERLDSELSTSEKEFFKSWQDRFRNEVGPISGTETNFHALCGSLIERYRRNELILHLHMQLSVNDGKRSELCTAIENPDGTSGLADPNFPVFDGNVFSGHRTNHEACEQYPSVLVDVREFIQSPEQALVEILPQVARLQTLDLCNRAWGYPVKSVSPNLLFEKFNRATDGKHIFFSGLTIRSKYKFPYKVIEGRTEILQDVSENQSKANGHGAVGNELEDSLIIASVRLSHHFARIALKVPLKFGVEGLNVLCGPEDFEFDGIKRSHGASSRKSFGVF